MKMPASVEDYEVMEVIGSGSYGNCKKVRRKRDGKILAWKEISYRGMCDRQKQMLVSEVNVLRELRQKNIVRYYDRIVDKKNCKLYIVMEHCEAGDLGSLIEESKKEGCHIKESYIWKVCKQMTLALHECHSSTKRDKPILHRDLKPANIFLDAAFNAKLGDFGLARVLSDESLAKSFVGTPYYMSPEQMLLEEYDETCDIWSLGCVLYEMAALRTPFVATNHAELAQKICKGDFLPIPKCYSDHLRMFISRLLHKNQEKRPSTQEILSDPSLSRVFATAEKCRSPKKEKLQQLVKSLRKQQNTLMKREQDLLARERALDQKEREFHAKEVMLKRKAKTVAEKIAKRMPAGKENHSSDDYTNKEVNDINNSLVSVLMKMARKGVLRVPGQQLMEERLGQLCEQPHQEYTRLHLIKALCRGMARHHDQPQTSTTTDLQTKLDRISARATELQRLHLEAPQHDAKLRSLV